MKKIFKGKTHLFIQPLLNVYGSKNLTWKMADKNDSRMTFDQDIHIVKKNVDIQAKYHNQL